MHNTPFDDMYCDWAGYLRPFRRGVFGAGARYGWADFDYAFVSFGVLCNTRKISVSLEF